MNTGVWFLFFISSASASCPTDTACEEQFGRCYKFVDEGKDYFSAEDACKFQGGHLVSIRNIFEKGMIEDVAESMFAGSSDYWIGANHFWGNWSWTDGSPWQYTDWFPGQPGSEQAVSAQIGSGMWTTFVENAHKPFICGLPFTKSGSTQCPATVPAQCPTSTAAPQRACPTLPAPIAKPLCEDGWVRFGEAKSCYMIIYNQTFTSAEKKCNSLGGHLASVHSKAENDFIANYAQVGLVVDWYSVTYLGLYRVTNQWYWTDSSPVDFELWAEGEPNNSPHNPYGYEACAVLYTDIMDATLAIPYYWRWDDVPCERNERAAVCKKSEL